MESPSTALASATGRPVADVARLGENAYCSIWSARCGGHRVAFKIYKTPDARLPELEAAAVDLYHSVVSGDDSFIDSGRVAFDEGRRMVAVGFVPGVRLADWLRASARDKALRDAAPALMAKLGSLLRRFRERTTQPGERFDPFHGEYLRYCSAKLASAPGIGAVMFRELAEDAGELVAALEGSGAAPSFAHGDFVFRNIHVHEGRIGLIDFANSLRLSHTANDVHNLRIALANMGTLPADYRDELWKAFEVGLGPERRVPAADRFFREFHRRRWLMLNLRCADPKRWMRAARGLATFARAEHAP